jgi:hypothetical protein
VEIAVALYVIGEEPAPIDETRDYMMNRAGRL